MLTVVCWKWTQPGCRSVYTAEHVNVLLNMVERHYHDDHEVVCFTDDPTGIDPRVRCVPISDVHSGLQNPLGPEYPSCYRRLAAFHSSFERYVGSRFISVDLDAVIVDDVTDLWNREEDFVIWQSPVRAPDYNGSMWMLRTGARPEVYDEFNPNRTPQITREAGKLGSDQGWFSYRIPGEAVWTTEDGIWSWKPQLRNRGYLLPRGARIVFFAGHEKPWDHHAKKVAPWVKEHYR